MARKRTAVPSAAAIASALALLHAVPGRAQTGDLMVLKETGPRDKRVNMVIIGDGYTQADKEKFRSQFPVIVDAVLNDLPLKEYSDYFNVYGIFVASNQTGADNPSTGVTRDTYYGAKYVNGSRLLTIDDRKGMAVIDKYVPEADMRFAIVNSEAYGGSGGTIAVANYTSPEIIAHEAQHSFAGLGDEYDYEGVSPWEAPNTTQKTARAEIRWSQWISPSTPLPTPATPTYRNMSGLFEGAAYNKIGWFRPKQNCRMRENNIPFCEVCMEAVLLAMYDKVSPLDSAFPATATVSVSQGGIPSLRVVPKRPLSHNLEVTWSVDGVPAPDVRGNAFSALLPPGGHRVTALVRDTTSMVRRDPLGLLSDSASWKVIVTATTRAVGSARALPPRILEADSRSLTLRLDQSGACRVRLLSAAGEVLHTARREASGNGPLRIDWGGILSPGAYVAEATQGSFTVRKRFAVSP